MKTPQKRSQNQTLLEKTQEYLRKSGLKARKQLGQHFLVDEDTLAIILETAGLTGRENVIEVGPGPGVLTEELCLRAGRVAAVELDDNLAAVLKRTLASRDNLTVINRDILKISPEDIMEEAKIDPSSGYRVVANLPYYITSPVLRHFLEAQHKPEMVVVMVQKEVAEEIAAAPGRLSMLSIGIQLFGKPEIVHHVPAAFFFPVPKVDSAILKIIPYAGTPVDIPDTEGFFVLVRAGFSVARKQLGNSLANGLRREKEEVKRLLEKAEISAERRAETLSLEEWARLYRVYREEGQA
ncbi:MAG: ribosomal RNA small subunit methyltransferase A [Dehalococcoidales bacterium]|nr:ribosomal RNA small subunit methyltransferase A [Dehalococcoidales bacterium]